jgi:(E)-4-hydroxy-3-methylbut-2-enyl-diphosphate synthase
MKASNPKVMIDAYRLLVAKLNQEGTDCNYPLHLGVTEAGDGEDGRIKSAIGIGALLLDGLGDTIRVSLTEDSVHEIPVAQALVRYAESLARRPGWEEKLTPSFDPYAYERRNSRALRVKGVSLGENATTRVVAAKKVFEALKPQWSELEDAVPEIVYEQSGVREVDLIDAKSIKQINDSEDPLLVTVQDGGNLNPAIAFRILAAKVHPRHPILLKDTLNSEENLSPADAMIASSIHIGAMLCDGIGDAILIRQAAEPGDGIRLGLNILQASGNRNFKADYVACPSCGRTLFDLQSTTARIRALTNHLKGVRIAVMGCIVNGPGEMADADFGYVGGAPGKVNLYVGKKPVKFNIPENDAVNRLIDLIKEYGKWTAPSSARTAVTRR